MYNFMYNSILFFCFIFSYDISYCLKNFLEKYIIDWFIQ